MNKMVQNKQVLFSVLSLNSQKIKSFGVSKLGAFGSFITGNLKKSSDVDLLVEFHPDQKSFDNYFDLADYLESLLGRKVEIVTPQSLNRYIGPHILNQTEYVAI